MNRRVAGKCANQASRRAANLAALTVLVVGVLASTPSLAINPFTILKPLFQSADDAARLGGRNLNDLGRLGKQSDELGVLGSTGDDVGSLGLRYSDEAFEGMSRAEVDDVASAFSGMRAHSGDFFDDDVALIKNFLKSSADDPRQANSTVTISSEFPNIAIKVPLGQKFARAFRSFARARYSDVFSTRFSVEDLRVVTVGLADDASLSAAEAARFQRTLGRNVFDSVGPMARIQNQGLASVEGFKAALAPYKGKTVVVVGHIPDDLKSFFIFRNGVRTKVNIEAMMRAARENNVNLIPIGCNSEQLAELGAKGIISSGDVLARLNTVLAKEPKTVGDFLKTLSSEDLTLVFNPLRVRFASNQAEIVLRERKRTIGRVMFELARQTPRWMDSWDKYLEEERMEVVISDHDFCFTNSMTTTAFDNCLVVREEKRQLEASIRSAEYRINERKTLPLEIEEVKSEGDRLKFALVLLLIAHGFLVIFGPLIYLANITAAKWYEENHGFSPKASFSLATFRETLTVFVSSFAHIKEGWSILLLALLSVVVAAIWGIGFPLYWTNNLSNRHEDWLFIGIFMSGIFAGRQSLAMLWEAAKEHSFCFTVAAITPLLLALTAYSLALAWEHHEDLAHDIIWKQEQLAELEESREADVKLIANKSQIQTNVTASN